MHTSAFHETDRPSWVALHSGQVTADAKFTDLGADSLDTVEVMMALEEKFDVKLDEDTGEQQCAFAYIELMAVIMLLASWLCDLVLAVDCLKWL